jgi:hypothetical protein
MIRFKTIDALGLRWLLTALLLATAVWAGEAAAETYVILSMIGDHFTIVAQRRQTGSHLDVNEYQTVPNADPALDGFAAKVADAVIAKTRPDAGSVTIRADTALYKIRDSWVDAELTEVSRLVSDIKTKLPPISDARLLMITPYRDQPRLSTTTAELGSGKVSGLGFYVDTATWLRISETNHEMSRGYLGLFANFQLVLIDLETGKVAGQEAVALGSTHSSAQAPDRTPWNALTPAQKAQGLQSLMKRGIEASLPGMLSSNKK